MWNSEVLHSANSRSSTMKISRIAVFQILSCLTSTLRNRLVANRDPKVVVRAVSGWPSGDGKVLVSNRV